MFQNPVSICNGQSANNSGKTQASRLTLVAWMKMATNSSTLLGDCLVACFSMSAIVALASLCTLCCAHTHLDPSPPQQCNLQQCSC